MRGENKSDSEMGERGCTRSTGGESGSLGGGRSGGLNLHGGGG